MFAGFALATPSLILQLTQQALANHGLLLAAAAAVAVGPWRSRVPTGAFWSPNVADAAVFAAAVHGTPGGFTTHAPGGECRIG